MMKRTFASVTTKPCTCNYLQDAADVRDSPIHFSAETAEYHFAFGGHELVIYHCPFCGGAAPESKRDKLFVDIPSDEQSRLAALLEPIGTIDAAIDRLGKPDYDGFVGGKHRDADGESPTLSRQRMIRYERISSTAYVLITEIPGGCVHWQLQGKYIGDLRSTEPSEATERRRRRFLKWLSRSSPPADR